MYCTFTGTRTKKHIQDSVNLKFLMNRPLNCSINIRYIDYQHNIQYMANLLQVIKLT